MRHCGLTACTESIPIRVLPNANGAVCCTACEDSLSANEFCVGTAGMANGAAPPITAGVDDAPAAGAVLAFGAELNSRSALRATMVDEEVFTGRCRRCLMRQRLCDWRRSRRLRECLLRIWGGHGLWRRLRHCRHRTIAGNRDRRCAMLAAGARESQNEPCGNEHRSGRNRHRPPHSSCPPGTRLLSSRQRRGLKPRHRQASAAG